MSLPKTGNILKLKILSFLLMVFFQSCCFSSKNTSLGSHFYVSEYDIKDTRVMYCSDGCCSSGVDVVPQTVLEYDYNSKWIIAKADPTFNNDDNYFTYWVIDKEFISSKNNSYDSIKAHIRGTLDSATFFKILSEEGINLKLKKYLE